MKFYIFSSGSKGNATLIVDRNVHILIDMGISKKALSEHLANYHYALDDIDFILLTHEHSDHMRGLENIHDIAIYAGPNVYYGDNYHQIEPYHPFKYNHLTITPVQTSHEGHCPLGFIIENSQEKLVYITDTGYLSERNMELAKNATYYILESNHNRNMLLKTRRPAVVKEWIMSDFGHLSNEDSALYLSEMIGENTKQIYLAHISMEANTYDLAKETCIQFLKKKKINLNKLKIETAKQFESCEGGY